MPSMRSDEKVSACENKEVSSFCDQCTPYDCMTIYPAGFHNSTFIDRKGLIWICSAWKTCDHSIIMHDKIHSCRVRSAQIKDDERG